MTGKWKWTDYLNKILVILGNNKVRVCFGTYKSGGLWNRPPIISVSDVDEKIPVWGRSGKRVFQAEGEAIPNVLSYLHFIHQYRSQKKPDRPVIIWLFVLSCKLKQVVAPITATAPHVVYLLGHINMVSGILAIIWGINLFSALFSVPLRKGVQRQFAFTWDRQQHIFAVSTQGSVKFSLLFQNTFRRDLDHLGTPQNIILIYYFDGIELPEQGVGGCDANLEERIEKTDSDCLLWWIVSGVAKTTDPSNSSLISLSWEVEVPQRPGRSAHPSTPSWVENCICVAQGWTGSNTQLCHCDFPSTEDLLPICKSCS